MSERGFSRLTRHNNTYGGNFTSNKDKNREWEITSDVDEILKMLSRSLSYFVALWLLRLCHVVGRASTLEQSNGKSQPLSLSTGCTLRHCV